MYCSEIALVKHNGHAGDVVALPCKRWSCPHCQPMLRKRVIKKASSGNPNLFMTLTCRHDRYESPAEAAQDMRRGLVLLRRRIERRWGIKNVPFFVVFERHKSGWPHMHILMRATFMHWKVLRAMWNSIVSAYQVDIRFIKRKSQVLFYVTKYIGKALEKFDGCKRYWSSQNYSEASDDPFQAKTDQRPACIARGSAYLMTDALHSKGWEIIDKGRGRWFVIPPGRYGWKKFWQSWVHDSLVGSEGGGRSS